jgi:periplasmic divalent cation tolerance protein
MDGISLVYVTAADVAEAERLGRALVEERLAACVNILPGMRSIYRWKGAVESAQEAVLIVKTRSSRVSGVIERVKSLHSYTLPCAIELPIGQANPAYSDWLMAAANG